MAKDSAPTSGSGNATINYTVDAYAGFGPRIATIVVGGSTFRVTQNGLTCVYSLTAYGASLPNTAGTGTVEVRAGAECPGIASSPRAWAPITGGTPGTGNGIVNYSVTANNGAGPHRHPQRRRPGFCHRSSESADLQPAAVPGTHRHSHHPGPHSSSNRRHEW